MNLTLRMTGPKLTEKEIADFEKRIGCSLPTSYRQFLMAFNGGRPNKKFFLIEGWLEPTSLVNDFYGLVPGKSNNLDEGIATLKGRLPKGFISIADDPGGDQILISLDGETRGSVYFWDHENEPDDPSDNINDYSNMYMLADDFGEFLNALRDENEL